MPFETKQIKIIERGRLEKDMGFLGPQSDGGYRCRLFVFAVVVRGGGLLVAVHLLGLVTSLVLMVVVVVAGFAGGFYHFRWFRW